MAAPRGIAVASGSRFASRARLTALLVAAAVPLLATGCASTLGYNTPCSVWVSMNNDDQRATVTNLFQQQGESSVTSSEVSQFQNHASIYCMDPPANQPTLIGMLDSRAP
jgi:hypothetical protein